jgi:hypothetical protein
MDDNHTSTELLEPSLPGAWIVQHRRIWQMNFLNADKLARFGHDRGLASFDEKDVTQLWQLGLIKADLITSRRKLSLVGLVDRGTDRYGHHIYSDERQLPRRLRTWNNARTNLKPLQEGVELLFHPFRYYVLYHLDRVLELRSSRMQMLYQDGFPPVFDWNLSSFNRWSASEGFISSIKKWNETASLGIITEPYTFQRIFHSIKYDPTEVKDRSRGAEEINNYMVDYWHNNVEKLYLHIGMERLEEIRQDLCFDTQMLDRNRWIHTLLCLGDSKLRIELEGRLGGALLLRTMAEMFRRATEEAFDKELREEDELGTGWVPKDAKEKIYGSNRLLDDHRAAGTFARRHGLNYKPRVHVYGEGSTEYGAFNIFFTMMGISVQVTNLHGLIKEGKSMVTFFRDELYADIKAQRYSLVIIDGDVRENVRILESAARNNQTCEDEGIFGRFFLSDPDLEFANFEIEELEEVLWTWVGGESPSQADRELLHKHVKSTTGSTEFFKGVKRAALVLPRLVEYDKCAAWGEELMKFAWEHPYKQKQKQKRQIVEIVELALYWERTISLERYDEAQKKYTVNPQNGEIIPRASQAQPQQ